MLKNISKRVVFTIYLSFFFSSLYAQPFQNSKNPLKGVLGGQSAMGDLDNDGDMDLMVSGTENLLAYVTRIYQNDGTGKFTVTSQSLPGIEYGSIDLSDFDKDGLLDILLVRSLDASIATGTRLFKNKGSFKFEEVTAGLPLLHAGMGRFGDYDNDGDADIVLVGTGLPEQQQGVYRNNSGQFSFLDLQVPKHVSAAVSWGDYDQDGDLDYIVSGNDTTPVTIYKNQGSDIFLPVPTEQSALSDANLEWGDFNNDGKLDILMMGYDDKEGSDIFQVLENKGNGHFERISSVFEPLSAGNGVWGDIDNDGDLDIVATGSKHNDFSKSLTCIYVNTNGIFTKQIFNLPQLFSSHVSLGDADNDRDLDIIITGTTDEFYYFHPQTFLYLNNSSTTNTTPIAPASLQQVVDGQKVRLSWNSANDSQTPSLALTYNLYCGLSSGSDNIIVSLSDIFSGYRKVVRMGNTQHNLSWEMDNLSPGTYYWGVQSIDGSYVASAFSAEKTFTIQNAPHLLKIFLRNLPKLEVTSSSREKILRVPLP